MTTELPPVAYPSAAELRQRIAGQTVASVFLATANAHGSRVGLRWKVDDAWQSLTYSEYADQVARVAGGLQSLGVGPGDRVALMMRNIAEFHVIDVACYFCGATPISIYNSSTAEQVAYLAGHSDASIAIVEDHEFLARFRPVREQLPSLRVLASIASDGADMEYGELLAAAPIDLEAASARVNPDDLATVIYTSGTTGPPKGVMITHGQVCFTEESLQVALGRTAEELLGVRVISYLPMAHIAERMTSHYGAIRAGYDVITCPDMGLVAQYLREVRPNVFFGVPRVWEKIYAGVLAALSADSDRLRQFNEAVEAAKPIVDARAWGRATDEQEATWQFLDELAFAPARARLGLDQVICCVSGAAALPSEMLTWFRAIGVPLSELYGMSESCGPISWEPRRVKPGTVGRAIPGGEITLADDGEVLYRGGTVFAGYLNDDERTAETIDGDGWLHTGDVGIIDDDGYLRIVDRKKELIITAGGKNVSPANLEAKLKLVPLVGQALAVGDDQPYIAALLVLDPDDAAAFAAREHIGYDTLADLAANQRVHDVIARGVDEVMQAFNQAERVKKFVILPDDWLPDSDELTPTSKLKRRAIRAKYAAQIRSLYE